MGDERRPPSRLSIPVTQSGNPNNFTFGSSESSSTGLSSLAGDAWFRVSNDNPSNRTATTSTGKVAIPRATNLSDQSGLNKRVGHACEPCREQKTKCSGDRPTCQRCQDFGLSCVYGDRKRERTAKQLKDLSKQVQEYQQLLIDLQPRLYPEDAQLIQETLSRYKFDGDGSIGDELSTPVTRSGPSDSAPSETDPIGTPARPFVTNFLSGADYTEEDFNRNERSKALGFVGKHSEISWLYQLKRDLDFKPSSSETTRTPEGQQDHNSIASVSYFLDDEEISIIEDADPMARPPQAIANNLVQNFFQSVYPTFPIIVKDTFVRQVNNYYTAPFVRPGRRWLAVLNLVFATSSRCYNYQMMQPNLMAANEDSLLYFSRAWKLSMKERALLDHPDLQQVQIEGLTAIFLLASGHVNRAWRICGMAIRSATAMGLNLRSESNYVTLASKESRYKVWWSLYTLETILGNITGRPLSVDRDFCTTPLPVPFEEHEYNDTKVIRMMTELKVRNSLLAHVITKPVGEVPVSIDAQTVRNAMDTLKPNTALYFVCYIDLMGIIREIVETLYAPETVQNPSLDAGGAIVDANAKLEVWASKLPPSFRFLGGEKMAVRERFNLNLALQFYSAKIIATKPCLQYSDRTLSTVLGDESFYDRMAASCVQAACRMLDLFPPEYDASWLHQVAPWWCILHYLVQATAVLLTDFPLNPKMKQASPGPGRRASSEALEKAASWLSDMAKRDMASKSAFTICGALLAKLSQMASQEVL